MSEKVNQYQLTLHNIISIYKSQLSKFYRLGIGNETEFKTVITDTLINCTKRRLKQLTMRHSKLLRNGYLPEFRHDE